MRFRLLPLLLFWSTVAVVAAYGRQARAAVPDSLVSHATLLAARGEVAELRPIFAEHGAAFPRYARLYCDMALARADRRNHRLIACIDTLTTEHEAQLGLRGRISLEVVKAEALRQTGQYARLADYCRERIKTYKRRRVRKALLAPFEALLEKGQRLSGTAPRTLALQCADRDDAFTLAEKYAGLLPAFDTYARLRCRLTMAEAYGRDDAAFSIADSLLTSFPDSLDTQDLTRCLRARAGVLIRQGHWAKLAETSEAALRLTRVHAAPLQHYLRMGQTLRQYAPTAVERPREETAVPVSFVFPLLVKGRLGAAGELYFRLDTGQAHTLLSEDDARRGGVHFVGDTISIPSWAGLIKVKPALVEELGMGRIVFRRLLVYVVLESNDLPADFGRVLGANDLRRLKKVDIYDEKLVLPAEDEVQEPADFPSQPNLRLSAENILRLRATADGQEHQFSLDTGCDGIVLSRVAFPETETETCSFRFLRHSPTVALEDMTLSEERAADHDGLLGAPFVRQFECLHLDFRNMQVTAEYRRQAPAEEYDPFAPLALTRNFQSLLQSAPGETERNNLFRLREQYAGKHLLEKLAGSPQAVWQLPDNGKNSCGITYDDPGKGVCTGRVGKRQVAVAVTLRPYGAHVALSGKMARRLKVRLPKQGEATPDGAALGIIDRLEIGGAVLENLRCLVCTGQNDTLQLGYEALALLPAVTFEPESLTLHRSFASSVPGIPFAVTDAVCLQGETPRGFALLCLGGHAPMLSPTVSDTLYINNVELPRSDFKVENISSGFSANAMIPLNYLVKKLGRLTLDFTQALAY